MNNGKYFMKPYYETVLLKKVSDTVILQINT